MPAVILIDHRLALLALAALLIAAAAPLAYAWAKLLPEEPPPFEVRTSRPPEATASNPTSPTKRDPFAVFLLICMTLSYVLRFPGLPLSAALQWLSAVLPADYFSYAMLAGRWFFMAVPSVAVAYSALRSNPVRIALIAGGLLVLALWLVSPMLRAAIATA